MIQIIDTKTTLHVTHLYNGKFNKSAELAGAKLVGRECTFDSLIYAKGRQLADKFFGWNGEKQDVVSIKLTAKENVFGSRSSIEFFGHVLAKASGRDSGAIVPQNVFFMQGKPKSGGSVKNWTTGILQGSEIVIREFPRKTFNAVLKKGHEKYDLELYVAPKLDDLQNDDFLTEE